MAFLDKNGLQTLTNKLVQGDAIKVASHRGHTVKNVIDNITRECENVASPNVMKLESNLSEFKIGKGRDVDVSGDVEEGKVEVELKGKTYQNLVELEKYDFTQLGTSITTGDYSTINSTKNGLAVLVTRIDTTLLKPNTIYSLKIEELPKKYKGVLIRDYYNATNLTGVILQKSNLITFTTPNIIGQRIAFYYYDLPVGAIVKTSNNITILEGDHTQTPTEELPKYFEGIKSSFEDGIVDVEVIGKNLFDAKDFCDKVNNPNACQYEDGALIVKNSSHDIGFNYNFPCYISFNIKTSDSQNTGASVLQVTTYDGSVIHLDAGINGERFKEHYVPNIKSIKLNSWARGTNILKNFQIERTQFTPYEPYYKKKISFNIGEPLRSLPNGVCDEIRNNNGQWELIRKIGKVVLNGSEGWNLGSGSSGWNVNGNTLPFYAYLIDDKKVNGHSLTDLFTTSTGSIIIGVDEESFNLGHSNYITIRLKRDKLLTEDANGFKQWLSQNPTTVYYELKEPIITPIEPMEFDVKPLATMTINSEIAPVSNHKVVLNRAGQIEQGIIQIAELKSRVDALETAYDSYLLETQHKLSLLGFEYELESEEV